MRAFVSYEKVYVWDAYEGCHGDVDDAGLGDGVAVHFMNDKIDLQHTYTLGTASLTVAAHLLENRWVRDFYPEGVTVYIGEHAVT